MSTEVALPDVVNIDFHRPVPVSAVSHNTPITSQPLFHSLTNGSRRLPYHSLDDSSVHGSPLEGLPHVNAQLDAR